MNFIKKIKNYKNIIANIVVVILIITNITFWQLFYYFGSSYLEITFMDVGQGDSYIIKTPDKLNILIDCGNQGKIDKALNRNLNFFENIDIVVLTHPDSDHVGDMADIIKEKKVKKVFIHDWQVTDNNLYRNLNEEINNSQIEKISAQKGEKFKIGCCIELFVLWPENIINRKVDDVNNFSFSFILKYKDFYMFAAGDLGQEIENQIIENIKNMPNISVLKVSHHGSKTSSSKEFLKKLNPEISVIQVGENDFGHPSDQVIQNLNSIKSQIYRNDFHGDVVILTDGSFLKVKSQN